jgi:hypothetical protein
MYTIDRGDKFEIKSNGQPIKKRIANKPFTIAE